MIEPATCADLGTQPQRGERVDPAHAPQPADRMGARGTVRELGEARPRPDRVSRSARRERDGSRPASPARRGRRTEPRSATSGAFATTPPRGRPSRSRGAAGTSDPVPGAHQIHANVLPAADKIAQLLALDRRDRDQRQLAGRQQLGQADRVALVGLDPIRRRTVTAAGCAHRELDPVRDRAARQPIAGRARLIHHPRRPLDIAQPRQQLVRAPRDPPGHDLVRGLVKDRERRLPCVHVQTDPTDNPTTRGCRLASTPSEPVLHVIMAFRPPAGR